MVIAWFIFFKRKTNAVKRDAKTKIRYGYYYFRLLQVIIRLLPAGRKIKLFQKGSGPANMVRTAAMHWFRKSGSSTWDVSLSAVQGSQSVGSG